MTAITVHLSRELPMNSSEDFKPIVPGVTIGHVHLKVADLERALTFYRGVLGFELTQIDDSLSAAAFRREVNLDVRRRSSNGVDLYLKDPGSQQQRNCRFHGR